MSVKPRTKPAIPLNIQALIRTNDLHAEAVEQAKINLAKSNETRFREEHQSYIRNAEVRRNMRQSQDEAILAKNDLMVDRRKRLAALFKQDEQRWDRELQVRGLTIIRD